MKQTTFKIVKNNIPAVKKIMPETLRKAAMAGGTVIENYAKINVNEVFSAHATGASGLQGSIHTVLDKMSNTRAEVSVGTAKIYARIQELGGIILPVHAKMLSWISRETGIRLFAKKVVIPARPYLRPAADEHEDEIRDAVGDAIKLGIRGAL